MQGSIGWCGCATPPPSPCPSAGSRPMTLSHQASLPPCYSQFLPHQAHFTPCHSNSVPHQANRIPCYIQRLALHIVIGSPCPSRQALPCLMGGIALSGVFCICYSISSPYHLAIVSADLIRQALHLATFIAASSSRSEHEAVSSPGSTMQGHSMHSTS